MANILGISAFYHDSAACLVQGGRVVAAASEERFSRTKGDPGFPRAAAQYCLDEGRVSIQDLDAVAFYDKPFLKFERILETFLATSPRGLRNFLDAGPIWIKEKLEIGARIRRELDYEGEVLFSEHHESHAASAFLPSPFENAAILTLDGVGEWATTSIGLGERGDVSLLREMRWPDSLGLLYSAFTYHLGFKVNSGEYKVMGLAPYGSPRFAQRILNNLLDLKEDGSFRLNQHYFTYLSGRRMAGRRFAELFGCQRREPEAWIEEIHCDLAASVQAVCEEVVLRLGRTAARLTGSARLCMAGGVALNCVANGRLLREGPFEDIWVQPAAGDAGGALGVALLASSRRFSIPPQMGSMDGMAGSLLGPAFSDDDIAAALAAEGIQGECLSGDELIERTAACLEEGAVVGWFQGRMEFGPRALGARSILADPRNPDMQRKLNLKIKYRESFRPFAPSVKAEAVAEYFEIDRPSPYMLFVAQVREGILTDAGRSPRPQLSGDLREALAIPRSAVPAVTHVDNSARIQTVHPETNPRFHQLLAAFERRTGCGVLVNTSFNVRGEPIVCTPLDAVRCFLSTEMDRLSIGSFLVSKADVPDAVLRRARDASPVAVLD